MAVEILRGLLGIGTLLGIAVLFSFYKRKIDWRLVGVGMGLQFLFAVIILKNDAYSFAGMGVLGLLIVNFILKDELQQFKQWQTMGIISAIAVLIGAVLTWVGSGLGYLLCVLLISLIFLHVFRQQQLFRWSGAFFLITGIAFLTVHNYHGQFIFQAASNKVAYFLSLSDYGAEFLFGNLVKKEYFTTNKEFWPGFGFQFAFKVLPTIVFFGGFMAIMYYLGVVQKVVEALSHFMRWMMGTSGAETLSCSANIFVGQTESPLLIKPFLDHMTRSELLTIMVGGFATIAGGVLAGYIAMGIPAGHLIAASVMSAPAALVIGKVIYPELEHSETAGDVEMPDIKSGDNAIEAATNGILDGLKLAVNVGAMLLGFIALIAVLDLALNWLDAWIDGQWLGGTYVEYGAGGMTPATGEYTGYFPGSLQTLFGTILRPLAWLMGVPWQDANQVGNLLGIKLTLNEFVAYGKLGSYIQNSLIGEKAKLIATYALCGFANFSSIGIQIGGISALAPNRKKELAKIGLKAMFGGAIASWLTATIAGMLL